MKSELETEMELSAQYIFGDDPGLAVVQVTWLMSHRTKTLEPH